MPIAEYGRALAIGPQYISAYANRALAYADLQKYEAAEQDYTACLNLVPAPDRGQFHRLIGIVRVRAGNQKAGCASLRRALALGDTSGLTRDDLTKLYNELCQ